VVSIGRQKGFSISVDPDDPAQFVERVREILTDSKRRQQMSEAAAAVAPEYERTGELQKLLTLVERAARAVKDSKV
jgi:glycosyltransferase involved in cell wall biosynthesis